jgi:hypothetical protein
MEAIKPIVLKNNSPQIKQSQHQAGLLRCHIILIFIRLVKLLVNRFHLLDEMWTEWLIMFL